MIISRIALVTLLSGCLALHLSASNVQAGLKIAIVHADTASSATELQTKLEGLAAFSVVDLIDAGDVKGTPSLSTLLTYDAVLSYTNYSPDDNVALGNVLADYVDAGRGVVLATYGIGDYTGGGGDTSFAGRITNPGYAPLVITSSLTDLDGGIMAIVPADPIFSGIDLNTPNFYYHDFAFANPDLDRGATLLATDNSGVNLIARSANGHILGMNLFPGTASTENSDAFTILLGNELVNVASYDTVAPSAVPEPATIFIAAQATLIALAVRSRVRHKSRVV